MNLKRKLVVQRVNQTLNFISYHHRSFITTKGRCHLALPRLPDWKEMHEKLIVACRPVHSCLRVHRNEGMSNRRHTLHLKQAVNSQKWAWLGGFNGWLSGSVEGLGYSQGPTSLQLPTYHKHKGSAWRCTAAKEAYVFKQACCLIISYIITHTVFVQSFVQLCNQHTCLRGRGLVSSWCQVF